MLAAVGSSGTTNGKENRDIGRSQPSFGLDHVSQRTRARALGDNAKAAIQPLHGDLIELAYVFRERMAQLDLFEAFQGIFVLLPSHLVPIFV